MLVQLPGAAWVDPRDVSAITTGQSIGAWVCAVERQARNNELGTILSRARDMHHANGLRDATAKIINDALNPNPYRKGASNAPA